MVTVVAKLDTAAAGPDDPRLAQLAQAISDTAGFASVTPARVSDDKMLAYLRVQPDTAPSDPAAVDTIDALRAISADGTQLHITGQTAIRAD